MNRLITSIMKHISAWLVAIPLSSLAPPASADDVSRPNVLMIIADDLNDWVGCLQGHPDVKTPNIDRLAKRGLLFANAHCAAPVCNPSRVATLTGRRPSSSGVYGNDTVWHEVMPGVATIPQHFKAHGYFVAGGGKVYHHPPGFNRRIDLMLRMSMSSSVLLMWWMRGSVPPNCLCVVTSPAAPENGCGPITEQFCAEMTAASSPISFGH